MRRAAQIVEAELCDVRGRERDGNGSTPNGEEAIGDYCVAGIDCVAGRLEELVKLGEVLAVDGVEVDARELAGAFSVVCGRLVNSSAQR